MTNENMPCFRNNQWAQMASVLVVWLSFSGAGLAHAAVPDTSSAESLRAQYVSLGERLRYNPFQRALALDSAESNADLKGDIYALVDYPFAIVSAALNNPGHWCDVLILHINTKYCRATSNQTTTTLNVNIGKKTPQSLKDAYPIEFTYRGIAATANYLEVQLNAREGPLSTSNYRIQLQAIPVGSGQTFLHFTYSYDYGLAGRLAMKAYLATLGSEKVGFTLSDTSTNGQPDYIGGMRGVVERNTMRYYLAIDAYLIGLGEPASVRLQKRLQHWFNATEQYPRQLHEVSRTAYLNMKRSEYQRQQISR